MNSSRERASSLGMFDFLSNNNNAFVSWKRTGRTNTKKRFANDCRQDDADSTTTGSLEKRRNFPCSDLTDLIVDLNWNRALIHCQQYPMDARYVDGDTHETPLHVACQLHSPVFLIRQLLQVYPEAATMLTRYGNSPLHLACKSNASIDVIRCLIQAKPETASLVSKWGKTPVSTLWDCRSNHPSLFWGKVRVLLEGIADARGSPGFLVHAAVSLQSSGCPISVLQYALDECPDIISRTDPNGLLPIHLAVGPTLYNPSTRRKYKPREKEVLSLLLENHPASARALSPDQRWPLAIALANEHSWGGGIEDLWKAAPETLSQRDSLTRLYPYQIAATKSDLETTFNLLRVNPSVLTNANVVHRQPPSRANGTSNLLRFFFGT